MTCPRCAAANISPDTGTCDLCGFRADATVAVERTDELLELATKQLAHEFDNLESKGRTDGSLVLRANERKSGSKVILKVVQRRHDDAEIDQRFRHTMVAWSQLDHPHLVPVIRYGATDSLLWYASPVIDASPIRTLLDDEDTFDPRRARRIATQIVSALEYLHRHGVVHGAVKAENVLVDEAGWAWLADPTFERTIPAARRRASADDNAPTLPPPASRPSWVAPEDLTQQERRPASDQYALAALLFECLTKRRPAAAGTRADALRPDVPVAMSHAISRALNANPTRRFPSCADFLWAIESGTAAITVESAPPTTRPTQEVLLIRDWVPPEDPERSRRIVKRVAIGAVLVIAVGAGLAPYAQRWLTPEPPVTQVQAPLLIPSSGAPAAAPSEPVATSAPTVSAPAPSTTAARTTAARTAATTPQRAVPPPSSIPRARTVPPAAEPATPARIFINATPWGRVFVDDVFIGNTPRAGFEVTPGERQIRVERPGYETFTRSVRVASGEVLRITDIVLAPSNP